MMPFQSYRQQQRLEDLTTREGFFSGVPTTFEDPMNVVIIVVAIFVLVIVLNWWVEMSSHDDKSSGSLGALSELPFKGGVEAFEYACKFLSSDVSVGQFVPALVQDVGVEKGGNPFALVLISTHRGQEQLVTPILQGTSGGFPTLKINDFVGIQIIERAPSELPFSWLGVVCAVLEPTFNLNSGWAIAKRIRPGGDWETAPGR